MAQSPRELSFSYAGLSVGGASTTHKLWGGPYSYDETYDTVDFAAQVLCQGTDDASFALACDQLETAFHTPNGALSVSLNSTVINAFSHTGNTGFLARPTCRKVGGMEDSARSRLYSVTVSAQRPADLAGKDGLRVAAQSFRREVWGGLTYTITGTYTAIGGTLAYDQYQSAIGALLTSYETQLGGTWLRAEEDANQDDTNRVLSFTRTGIQNGLRNGLLEVTVDKNLLRSYRITGMYTAEAALDARGVYDRDSPALFALIETGLGGIWLTANDTSTNDQTSKTITFMHESIETGLRNGSLDVTTDTNGLISYRLAGQYEAEPALDSRGVYDRDIAALVASIEADLTGDFLTVSKVATDDQTKKITSFTHQAIETGLRESFLEVLTTTNGLRSYRVSGQYEASGASSSNAEYLAGVGALQTAIEGALSGSWLRTTKAFRDDQTKKITSFTHEAIETGLREATFNVEQGANGRRTYLVAGQYEADAGSSALQEYTANINTLLTAFEGTLTGNWERVLNRYVDDQTSKILSFEWTGLEVLKPESSGATDVPYLKNVVINISVSKAAPGDSGSDTTRPSIVEAFYSADVDWTVPGAPSLSNIYKDTIKPYLLQLAKDSVDASSIALVKETPQFGESNRKVSAALVMSAYGGGTFIQRTISVQDEIDFGIVLIPVWNGDPDACVQYQGPRRTIKTVNDDALEFAGVGNRVQSGSVGVGGIADGGSGTGVNSSAPIAVAVPNSYALLSEVNKITRLFVGISPDQVELQARITTRVYRFRNVFRRI